MSAVQVGTTAADLAAADPDQHRELTVQNLGPNAIYLELGAAATVAGGLKVAASGGSVTLRLPPSTALSAIAETAAQSTPADTRLAIA